MKLIIDIPEEEYELIVNDEACGLHPLTRAIANGTPLPKGHGRLIDADATLKRHCTELCAEKPSCYEDCLIYDLLHLAPTIIEADKAESEVEK